MVVLRWTLIRRSGLAFTLRSFLVGEKTRVEWYVPMHGLWYVIIIMHRLVACRSVLQAGSLRIVAGIVATRRQASPGMIAVAQGTQLPAPDL